jgi:hypothetical protein
VIGEKCHIHICREKEKLKKDFLTSTHSYAIMGKGMKNEIENDKKYARGEKFLYCNQIEKICL